MCLIHAMGIFSCSFQFANNISEMIAKYFYIWEYQSPNCSIFKKYVIIVVMIHWERSNIFLWILFITLFILFFSHRIFVWLNISSIWGYNNPVGIPSLWNINVIQNPFHKFIDTIRNNNRSSQLPTEISRINRPVRKLLPRHFKS